MRHSGRSSSDAPTGRLGYTSTAVRHNVKSVTEFGSVASTFAGGQPRHFSVAFATRPRRPSAAPKS